MVQLALGDAVRRDHPEVEKYVPMPRRVDPVPVRSEAIGVLFPGDAAARLGITRAEVERMIAARKMWALPTGFTVTVPTSEVERVALERARPR